MYTSYFLGYDSILFFTNDVLFFTFIKITTPAPHTQFILPIQFSLPQLHLIASSSNGN